MPRPLKARTFKYVILLYLQLKRSDLLLIKSIRYKVERHSIRLIAKNGGRRRNFPDYIGISCADWIFFRVAACVSGATACRIICVPVWVVRTCSRENCRFASVQNLPLRVRHRILVGTRRRRLYRKAGRVTRVLLYGNWVNYHWQFPKSSNLYSRVTRGPRKFSKKRIGGNDIGTGKKNRWKKNRENWIPETSYSGNEKSRIVFKENIFSESFISGTKNSGNSKSENVEIHQFGHF